MTYVTSFERIAEKRGVQQGIQQGIQQGMQQGMQQGALNGRAELLLKLLAVKFGDIPEEIVSKVEISEMQELDRWAERVLTAETLDDVFA